MAFPIGTDKVVRFYIDGVLSRRVGRFIVNNKFVYAGFYAIDGEEVVETQSVHFKFVGEKWLRRISLNGVFGEVVEMEPGYDPRKQMEVVGDYESFCKKNDSQNPC